MFELLGTTTGCVRVMLRSRSVRLLRQRAMAYNVRGDTLKHWAIYRLFVNGRPFHNATDEKYLVEHWRDPYWLNRGIGGA